MFLNVSTVFISITEELFVTHSTQQRTFVPFFNNINRQQTITLTNLFLFPFRLCSSSGPKNPKSLRSRTNPERPIPSKPNLPFSLFSFLKYHIPIFIGVSFQIVAILQCWLTDGCQNPLWKPLPKLDVKNTTCGDWKNAYPWGQTDTPATKKDTKVYG